MKIKKALDGARTTYSVKNYPRLFLATNGKGGGSWRIRYRPHVGAQQCWLTISNDARNVQFSDVARKSKELLAGLEFEGIDPRSARPRIGGTFDQIFRQWLDIYARTHKKSWDADEKLYERHIKKRLGNSLIRSIDRSRVINVLDEIADCATPLQANRCQSVISAVFSWALDEGKIKAHPALRIRRRGEERTRELIMSNEQLKVFWNKLDGLHANAAIAVKLLLLTGQRLGEVTGISLSELQLDSTQPSWTIPSTRTKNGLLHIVPLTDAMVSLLREARAHVKRQDNPFVFPARRTAPQALDGNQVSRQCKTLFREIGLGNMRLHDLRHQAATGMAQCGVPLDVRQLVQNQITGRRQLIASVYDQHDYALEKRRALELWERRLIATVTGQQISSERYHDREGWGGR